MKRLVTTSLFIFWAVVVAILVAGLLFYQKNNQNMNQNNELVNNINADNQITLNAQEVAKHNTKADCWMIINNKVYNVTNYVAAHPGGVGAVAPYCGQDGTEAFYGLPHSSTAKNILAEYFIGTLNQVASQQTIQQNIIKTNNVVAPIGGEREYEDD